MLRFLILAAEAEEEPSGLDLILPAADELVWGTICFALVAFFLMRFAFPKIRESIEAREKAIRDANEGAERGRAEAQRLLDEYQEQLANSRAEANKLLEEARQSAEQVRKDLIAKAEEDAKGVVARAQDQIETQRGQAMEELRAEVRDLAIVVAEKVVGDAMDKSRRQKLVDDYIAEVGAMSPNGGSQN